MLELSDTHAFDFAVKTSRQITGHKLPATVVKWYAPGRSRTCDPRFRKPVLYPAELRALVSRTASLSKTYFPSVARRCEQRVVDRRLAYVALAEQWKAELVEAGSMDSTRASP